MSEDIVYSKKMVVSHEIGAGNVLEPSREFKAFNSINSDNILKYEISFIQRLGKFAGACLNRRINGTIYFGIADGKDGNYKHGEIIGLDLEKHHGEVFEEWVKKYFRGKKPLSFKGVTDEELKAAVSTSISPVHMIPTENGFVVEIDIEPSSIWCKEAFFPVHLPEDGGRWWSINYFLREGAHSIRMTQDQIETYRESGYLIYVNQRREDERKQKLTQEN